MLISRPNKTKQKIYNSLKKRTHPMHKDFKTHALTAGLQHITVCKETYKYNTFHSFETNCFPKMESKSIHKKLPAKLLLMYN